MTQLLHECSWTDAREYFGKNDLVVLPTGATEQHGPHNPLGTDLLIAEALAREAANRTKVLCLPTVPVGVSSHHRQFNGTLYARPDIFKQYVREICLSASLQGARKIVIVNGHGGNLWALRDIAQELREKGKVYVTIFQWWIAAKTIFPNIFPADARSHAGSDETSMNLAIRPDLVKMSRAVDTISARRQTNEARGLYEPLEVAERSETGVFGKPTLASPEKGMEIFEAVVRVLEEHINSLKKEVIEPPKPLK